MLASELRQKYLDFFAQKHGHKIIPGSSLLPENDPTVLFTTAGMHPLVPYLLGERHPEGTRLVDVQKCVRTDDIEEVGDPTHCTFFEMLGNWSLGDYFKAGAIQMSYEFLTQELGLDPQRLMVTCFVGDENAPRDDEAAGEWEKYGFQRAETAKSGDKQLIFFYEKKKNWWGPAGQTGPCGPDTEMFYDLCPELPSGQHREGASRALIEKYVLKDGSGRCHPNCECGRYVEIWNDVFMQYNKNEDGSFEPLKQQNVDTGMGLERVTAILQGKPSHYETELFASMLTRIRSLSTSSDTVSERIVADHIRSAVFILGDERGVTPSNNDLAKILPKDGTEGFFMVRTAESMPVLKSNSYANLPWVNALGWAEVDKKAVTFLEVNSSQEAESYLLSLRSEGEQLTSNRATRSLWSTVTCYPASKNPCFTWMGDLLILSDNENLLETLQKVASGQEESLKNSSNYQNIRSRLATWPGGFVYLDLQKILPRLSDDFKIFEPLLELYPAFGASLKPEGKAWSIESFLAVDKSLIGSEAYWHPTEKYEARFLPWTSESFAVEWGGRDLGEQVLQMETLLQKRTESGAALFAKEFETRLQTLFGADISFTEDLQPLLDGEQYFGFTPSNDFLFLTSLDSEDELNKALQLKEAFASNYLYAKNFQTPEGETQARLTPLTQTTGQYQNYQYYSFTVEDEEVATVLFTESMAIVAGKQATAFDALDRMEGRSALRSVDSLDSLLTGSNELFTVHCLLLPDGSILKTLLGDFDTITTARKLFDDGIFARSIVQLSTPHD